MSGVVACASRWRLGQTFRSPFSGVGFVQPPVAEEIAEEEDAGCAREAHHCRDPQVGWGREVGQELVASFLIFFLLYRHSLELNDKSPVVGNGSESGRQLFVSFPFLDVNPERLETLSQPIPAQPGVAIPFDFKLV